jgi:uncharacterized membrane protein YqgA involved in biofilm formation
MLTFSGALLNAAAILAGGIFGLATRKPLSPRIESSAKVGLGVFAIWFGLRLSWRSFNGSIRQVLGELGVVLLAMALGKMLGKLLKFQKLSNAVGRAATRKLAQKSPSFDDGFLTATALFCAAPLAAFASVQEGLNGPPEAFVVKAIMDGLGTMAFSASFGWSASVSALPVLAYETALTRGVRLLEPALHKSAKPLLDSVNATDGLLIFCVGLIILQLKRIEIADYLPSLALAPLLMWWLW